MAWWPTASTRSRRARSPTNPARTKSHRPSPWPLPRARVPATGVLRLSPSQQLARLTGLLACRYDNSRRAGSTGGRTRLRVATPRAARLSARWPRPCSDGVRRSCRTGRCDRDSSRRSPMGHGWRRQVSPGGFRFRWGRRRRDRCDWLHRDHVGWRLLPVGRSFGPAAILTVAIGAVIFSAHSLASGGKACWHAGGQRHQAEPEPCPNARQFVTSSARVTRAPSRRGPVTVSSAS